jgi:hypothetical protein
MVLTVRNYRVNKLIIEQDRDFKALLKYPCINKKLYIKYDYDYAILDLFYKNNYTLQFDYFGNNISYLVREPVSHSYYL